MNTIKYQLIQNPVVENLRRAHEAHALFSYIYYSSEPIVVHHDWIRRGRQLA